MLYALLFLLFIIGWLFLLPAKPPKLPPLFEIGVNIDRSFTPQERVIILNALAYWENATHGLVQYNIINKEAEYLLEHSDGENSLNFVRVHSEHPSIIKYEKENKNSMITLGIAWCRPKSRLIYLVYDRMKNKKILQKIVLHEIGHTLGLDHMKKTDTVMYPYASGMSDVISKDDIGQLIFNIRRALAQDQK